MNGQKTIKVILLFVVCSIWGVIFFQIFSHDFQPQPIAKVSFHKVANDSIRHKSVVDTLDGDYPDPFLTEDSGHQDLPLKADSARLLKKQTIMPPDCQYLGIISNISRGKRVGMIRFQEKTISVKMGSQIDQIKVLAIRRLNIEVRYKGATFRIDK